MEAKDAAQSANDVVEALRTEVDSLMLCPRSGYDLDRTLVALLSKSIRLAAALCSLARSGFHGEAFGLARSSLENFLVVKYISNPGADREQRATSYLDFFKAHIFNRDRVRQQFFPNIDADDERRQRWIEDAKRFGSPFHWRKPKLMAEEEYLDPAEVDSSGAPYTARIDYMGFYEQTSHWVHCNCLSLQAHLDYAGEWYKVYPYPEKDEEYAILGLHYGLSYLWMTAIIVTRYFGTSLSVQTTESLSNVLEQLKALLPQERIVLRRTASSS